MTNLDLSIRCACGCGNHLRVEVRGTDVRIALQGAAYGTGTGTKGLRHDYATVIFQEPERYALVSAIIPEMRKEKPDA